jgi:hypothetical protein
MYQKMRLIREKNQLVLDQTKFSSQIKRIEKNIANQNKRYSSLFTQLENQAKMMQSNAQMFFQSMSGLGCGSVNPMDYTGLNGFVTNFMGNMLVNQGVQLTKDGTPHTMGSEMYQTLMDHYMSNGGNFIPVYEDDGKTPKKINGVVQYEGFTADDVTAFTRAMQAAKLQQDQTRLMVQNANTQYGNNISIWLEAEKARLEAEQDAVLSPLNEQQTMLELEKEQTDARLTRINSELEIYKELCSQEAKNTAPTFGLR